MVVPLLFSYVSLLPPPDAPACLVGFRVLNKTARDLMPAVLEWQSPGLRGRKEILRGISPCGTRSNGTRAKNLGRQLAKFQLHSVHSSSIVWISPSRFFSSCGHFEPRSGVRGKLVVAS